jgi:peptide/nickel transport system substrate-binding protein
VSRRFVISLLLIGITLAAHARTRPHYGGTLRVEIEGDPWQQPNGLARRLVLDGLTRMSSDGLPVPALAVDWRSENDNHRWQFRLRPGVHFSDGTALTSAAVVGSLNTSCFTNCPWTTVRAAGPLVIFTGDSPMPVLPALLAGDAYLISVAGASSDTAGGLVGTGAFQPAGFANGVLKLTANENCWQGRPFVDAIEMRVHRSVHDQRLDLSLGHADLVEVPAEELRQAQQDHLRLFTSQPVTLLALEIVDSGALSNPQVRSSISLAIDRSALSNVIYQKQGEVTASLLPANLSGYSFLFPAERDLNKAHELRGGLTPRQLTLSAEGGAALQLAAQRITLNLREAGFNVQVASGAQRGDLVLRTLGLESRDPQSALESLLRTAGQPSPVTDSSPSALFKVEHEFLDRKTLIPLLYLSRAYAISGRVRDLRLDANGLPDLADASLGDAP